MNRMHRAKEGRSEHTIQERILSKIAEVGDLLERTGEKVEDRGFLKIGDAIHKLGNRIEQLKKKNGTGSSTQSETSKAV